MTRMITRESGYTLGQWSWVVLKTVGLCRRLFEVRVGEQLMGKVTNIYRDRVWVDVGLIKDGSCSDSQNVLADKCRSDMSHGANWVRVPHIKEVRVKSWRSWCSCRFCCAEYELLNRHVSLRAKKNIHMPCTCSDVSFDPHYPCLD